MAGKKGSSGRKKSMSPKGSIRLTLDPSVIRSLRIQASRKLTTPSNLVNTTLKNIFDSDKEMWRSEWRQAQKTAQYAKMQFELAEADEISEVRLRDAMKPMVPRIHTEG